MLLYDYPLAYNPAKPRLLLLERQQQLQVAPAQIKIVNLFNGQSLDPEFLRINPAGTVPVLVDGSKTFTESLGIVRYIDQQGQPLGGNGTDQVFVDEWGEQVDAWDGNLFLTANTADSTKGVLQLLSNFRIKYAEARAKQNPDLQDVYSKKIAAMQAADELNLSVEAVKANDAKLMRLLDTAESRLQARDWLAGPAYSQADVLLTVLLWRITMAKLQAKFIEPRPHVDQFYKRVQQRPSWKTCFGVSLSGAGSAKWLLPAVAKAYMAKITGRY